MMECSEPLDTVLRDTFDGDFPPVHYGETLHEAATTIEHIVEQCFVDQDGLLYSGLDGRTMKPPTPQGPVAARPGGSPFGDPPVPRKQYPALSAGIPNP